MNRLKSLGIRIRTPDTGSRTLASSRGNRGAARALLSWTVCAVLLFAALTVLLSQWPAAEAAVSVRKQEEPVTVDPDLILEPGSAMSLDGPLVKRALEVADDREVRIQMQHLLTDKREDVRRALALSTRYLRHMAPILEQHGLPPELAYLCVIESGYHQSARSHAGAVGMWQIIRATARRFELRTDTWEDERLDFIRSTEGAAMFLSYLTERFDDWDHVLAAYNAGEGRVRSAIRKARHKGLEPVIQNLPLPRETRIYVPAFYAALLIALEPERYGLFPDYQPVLDFVEVRIPGGVPLRTVAEHLSSDVDSIKELNPSILRDRVPLVPDGYPLRVPCSVEPELARKAAENLNEVRYVSYRVRKGDTLWDISRKFGVSIRSISRLGQRGTRPSRIFPGEVLLVPLVPGEAG